MSISEKTHKRIMRAWIVMKFLNVVSLSLWIADLLNSSGLKDNKEQNIGGISALPLGLGFVLGAYSIAGFIASHHALFQYRADSAKNSPGMEEITPTENLQKPEETLEFNPNETTLVIPRGGSPIPQASLTLLDIAGLAGNAVSCAIDVAAPLALVLRMLTEKSDDFVTQHQVPIEWSFVCFGALAQWAETRACKNAILQQKNPKDFWVKITALGEFSGIFADLYFFARIFSLIAWQSGVNSKENNILGLNQWMLIPAAIFCFISAVGETICHMHINKHDESKSSTESRENTKLSVSQEAYLFGDGLAQAAEFASTIGNVTHLAMGRAGKPLSQTNELIVFASAFLLGIIYALPDVLKSRDALLSSENKPGFWSKITNCFSRNETETPENNIV